MSWYLMSVPYASYDLDWQGWEYWPQSGYAETALWSQSPCSSCRGWHVCCPCSTLYRSCTFHRQRYFCRQNRKVCGINTSLTVLYARRQMIFMLIVRNGAIYVSLRPSPHTAQYIIILWVLPIVTLYSLTSLFLHLGHNDLTCTFKGWPSKCLLMLCVYV